MCAGFAASCTPGSDETVIGGGAEDTRLGDFPDNSQLPPIANLPQRLEIQNNWNLVPAYPALSFDSPVALREGPGTHQLFVAERNGRMYAFDRTDEVATKQLVLDLSPHIQADLDSGLLGFVFHPEFGQLGSANANYLYVHYAFLAKPLLNDNPPVDLKHLSRLSRFTVDRESLTVDLSSELILIDQEDENILHQGGAMFFRPTDGFLYLSVGDEGGAFCSLDNCQRIDKDLFSGVLRIDVDQRGGETSHPIVRQPEHGTTAHYFIPNSNPFVGEENALEEFYAIGLRSPHSMTLDTVDDLAFIGDVGHSEREEIDVLAPGANFQWPALEANRETGFGEVNPAAPLGQWTSPLVELDRNEATAVIGGHVYRGEKLPSLQGKYLFGDYLTTRIWALSYELGKDGPENLQRELLVDTQSREGYGGLTAFGSDSLGELYILSLGPSVNLLRLQPSPVSINVPLLLSEVGVFLDTPEQIALPGFVSYNVQVPLFSDGAVKERSFILPPDSQILFHSNEPWEFPAGSVFVKHFDIALDQRQPDTLTRLETRLLIAGEDDHFYGLTYRWNTSGDDADLVLASESVELEITNPSGELLRQQYLFPSPADCMRCHDSGAGSVLGVRTAQMYNGDATNGGQLGVLEQWGLLNISLGDDGYEGLPSLSALDDETQSVETRVRSYLDANCSMCHGSKDNIRADFDARLSVPLREQGLVEAVTRSQRAGGGDKIIAPGQPERSELYLRDTSTLSEIRMPPLGRSTVDKVYVEMLNTWIQTMPEML